MPIAIVIGADRCNPFTDFKKEVIRTRGDGKESNLALLRTLEPSTMCICLEMSALVCAVKRFSTPPVAIAARTFGRRHRQLAEAVMVLVLSVRHNSQEIFDTTKGVFHIMA